MLFRILSYSISLVIIICVVGCSNSSNDSITVGCASNMQVAMDSIITIFENETGEEVNLISQSSGMLYSQIELGAPIDVYISANKDYTKTLYNKGSCEAPRVFAKGTLVFASQKHLEISSLEEYASNPKVRTIALPNLKTAPYGIAAKNHLINLGIYNDCFGQIRVGESIAQVCQYLKANVVDGGFVSNSFITLNEDSYNYLSIELENSEDLQHTVTLIKKSKAKDTSIEFIKFLSSQKSKEILSHYGYKPL